MRKILTAVAASLATLMAMTACGSEAAAPADDATLDPTNPTAVVVGASPVPHAKILEFVRDNLAEEAGIALEIQEFDDYVLPNEALSSGELDANYFQHLPYFENQVEEKGYEFEHGEGVHIEPFALFSNKHSSPDQVPDGGVVALTNDPSNQYRGLKLMETAGLLEDIAEDTTALTISDEQNPKGLQFEESQPEVVVQLLDDPKVDVALINGNFILNAGLKADDAIAIEAVEGNPYANILAWRSDNTNPGVAKLDELLHSDEVADFIKQEWPAGDVIPG